MAAAGESRLQHSTGGEGDDNLIGRLLLSYLPKPILILGVRVA